MTEHHIPTVQRFDVSSEGPVLPWLQLMVRDGKISHYFERTVSGLTRLELLWHGPDPEHIRLVGSFLRPGSTIYDGPPVETLATSIDSWLSTAEYPARPHCDGSIAKGWRIWNYPLRPIDVGQYVEFAVEPRWQEFHK